MMPANEYVEVHNGTRIGLDVVTHDFRNGLMLEHPQEIEDYLTDQVRRSKRSRPAIPARPT